MDLREALDNLAQYIPADAGATTPMWEVRMAAGALVDRVTELERQVESQRVDMAALAERVRRLDGSSGR
jgi:hypothetical protein